MADLVVPADLAVYDPLGGTPEPLMTGHDGVCFHTMAGSFAGTDAYFHEGGWQGTESHAGVAGSGFAKLWTPWNRQADANLEGNSRWLSIENADMGEGFSGGSDEEPPLTAAQLERGIRLAVYWCDKRSHQACPSGWRCHQEGIPARFIANSCERGIGTHYHGIAGRGLVTGCPRWSTSAGKICPRMVRHRQVRDIIVPEVARRLGGGGGGLFVHLTEAQENELYNEICGDPATSRLGEVVVKTRRLAAGGYLATREGTTSHVYWVFHDHSGRLKMLAANDPMLDYFTYVAAANGQPSTPVRFPQIDRDIIDGLPVVGESLASKAAAAQP